MIRSLTIKLVLLSGALGFILVLNWSGGDPSAENHRIKIENAAKHSSLSLTTPTMTGDLNRENVGSHALDLNLSTVQELEALPGIGSTLAKRIVEYRMQVGGFQSIQSLDQVKGIGTKKLQILSPLLKISPKVVARKPQG